MKLFLTLQLGLKNIWCGQVCGESRHTGLCAVIVQEKLLEIHITSLGNLTLIGQPPKPLLSLQALCIRELRSVPEPRN